MQVITFVTRRPARVSRRTPRAGQLLASLRALGAPLERELPAATERSDLPVPFAGPRTIGLAVDVTVNRSLDLGTCRGGRLDARV